MKVLIFEDNDSKFTAIAAEFEINGIPLSSISRVKALSEFFVGASRTFDLCVVDLWLPLVSGGAPADIAKDIMRVIEEAGGLRVPTLAITAFADEARAYADHFSEKGCIIFDYHENDVWKRALKTFVLQARDRHRYDFLVFCAIESERNAFLQHGITLSPVMRSGLEFCDFNWAGASGAVVLLSKMGLVSAAISTARVLESYAPKVVCMPGICGGISGNCELGQLLVTELCWEYQAGKWTDEFFAAEPYQVEIAEQMRIMLTSELSNVKLLKELESGFGGDERPSKISKPKLAVFSSGSAVIASEKRLQSVKQQHRKVAGIDMEIYAFHRAVRMCDESIKHFSAKTVVDRADVTKSDVLHEYGCYVSSKFCLSVISRLFPYGK